MEWKVLRSGNLDLEREHLNRILKEIKGELTSILETIGSSSTSTDSNPSNHSDLINLDVDDHIQYHTDGRALDWLSTRSTSDLPEGSNLYFTDERAQDAIAAAIAAGTQTNITVSYNDGSNSFDFVVPVSSLFTLIDQYGDIMCDQNYQPFTTG